MPSQPNSISPPEPNPQASYHHVAPRAVSVPGLFPRLAELGSADEDWTGITEQAKRRKLQNRLNQRARRQRLLVSKTQHDEVAVAVNDEAPEGDKQSKKPSPCRLGQATTRAQLQAFAQHVSRSHHHGTIDIFHLPDTVRVNVFYALARNIALLGFDDGWLTDDAVSPFIRQGPLPETAPACPDTLRPTQLQVSVSHHPWIDLFPCPRMRDNFLAAVLLHGEDAIDEDALCRDVVDGGAEAGTEALIAWTDPWSPRGWEVTEAFMRKWGWLVRGCVEMQAGTNAWRQRRGLPSLRFPGC